MQLQQTLSAYLFGFAFMSLFHGALSDSFGRRPVVLCGVAVFTLASIGCALAQTAEQLIGFRALQGLSTGAGIVVSRAVIRDMFAPADAQRMMSLVTLYFGVAPAIAPVIGGWFTVWWGWEAVFWFLAGVGGLLWVANARLLPETLYAPERQPFNVPNLLRGYRELATSPRFVLLALASGVPFNGMFLYVMAAPVFLGRHLGLAPTQFFWLFLLVIGGIMSGAWLSGRLAGRITPKAQVQRGFYVMLVVSLVNLAANLLWVPHAGWALLADRAVFVRLGFDDAGGHSARARSASEPARHGVFHAGVRRRGGQRAGCWRARAIGDGFDPATCFRIGCADDVWPGRPGCSCAGVFPMSVPPPRGLEYGCPGSQADGAGVSASAIACCVSKYTCQ